jgi:Amt family ammonium transporter
VLFRSRPQRLLIAALTVPALQLAIGSLLPAHAADAAALNPADNTLVLMSSALVLLMTPGLSYFYGGMVGAKSVISTMLQSFICLGGS